MNKTIFTSLLVLCLLAGSVSTAYALDGLLTLEETRNDPGGGVIFVLTYTGEFPSSYFTGFVTERGNKYPIDCHVEGNVVTCTTTRAVAGKDVVLYIGDFIFWTFVPAGGFRPSDSTTYCYNVYDYYFDESEEFTQWLPFDIHCQDIPAENGDILEDFYNPDYDDFFDYEFMEQSPGCFNTVTEDAYYYPSCPS